jgi:hypothetical protein
MKVSIVGENGKFREGFFERNRFRMRRIQVSRMRRMRRMSVLEDGYWR